jgi:L-fuculose-phosphate aldolase
MEALARAELVAAGAAMARAGLLRAAEGNLSVRLDWTQVLVTPSGRHKGRLTAPELVLFRLDVPPPPGASSEVLAHLQTYRRSPDVQAIAHGHPPAVLALASRGVAPDPVLLCEGALIVPRVAWVGDLPPGSRELADACAAALVGAPAAVMVRHGAIATGRTLAEAVMRLETLELLARLALDSGVGTR